MEQTIAAIIRKIRQMVKRQGNRDIKNLTKCTPSIHCTFENETVVVQKVIFDIDYDKLIVSSERFFFKPEFGQKKILHTYNNWNEFLSL